MSYWECTGGSSFDVLAKAHSSLNVMLPGGLCRADGADGVVQKVTLYTTTTPSYFLLTSTASG